jgi:hypothetical protein
VDLRHAPESPTAKQKALNNLTCPIPGHRRHLAPTLACNKQGDANPPAPAVSPLPQASVFEPQAEQKQKSFCFFFFRKRRALFFMPNSRPWRGER